MAKVTVVQDPIKVAVRTQRENMTGNLPGYTPQRTAEEINAIKDILKNIIDHLKI